MKKILAILLAAMMLLGLCACAASEPTPTTPATNAPETKAPEAPTTEPAAAAEKITLKVWGPQEDQADDNAFLPEACRQFNEAHPEWDIEFVFEVCAEGDAGTQVTKDPTAAADVYMFANDQLGTLLQANAVARLGGDTLAQVQADNSDTMIASVTSGEGVYGVPFTGNTWFMYYDKSVYSEEDIKSLDAMMAIKPVAFPVTDTWYVPSFFFAMGGTMFGDGTDGSAGITFGGEDCAAATAYLANALASGNMIDGASGKGLDALRNGTVGAMFSGTWDAKNVQETLGDNYGAAQLPCITVNGEEHQLYSFSGSKAYGVNPNSANMKAASALAAWLGSAEMQDLHFNLRQGEVIPCNAELLANDADYTSNPAALAQNATIANTSKLQPSIAEMGMYWTNAESLGKALENGEVTEANAAELTEKWNNSLNGL